MLCHQCLFQRSVANLIAEMAGNLEMNSHTAVAGSLAGIALQLLFFCSTHLRFKELGWDSYGNPFSAKLHAYILYGWENYKY